MHLKTLTVRGFKSFASTTTFEFEPGVTCVVGPNGSGKSNVVDALSWVMGEQGAKTLRGGTMEDVIFAGTSGRQALGRAHVSLTIDNTDGALPIEYTEVTISRTLFRTGGSEYAINGQSCRLLDIQELLSDSGLGREMHVVVGQGQLDRILHATPEERRGFIEEAAGILKHRRRKERTVRKLESMQTNLDRLEDLLAEIRRQLTPLGRQARVARRAQRIQYDLRDARARLLADDLVQARSALEAEAHTQKVLQQQKIEVEQQLSYIKAEQAQAQTQAAQATTQVTTTRETWYELTAVRERYKSLHQLASERRRLLGSSEQSHVSERDPKQLENHAKRTRDEQRSILAQVDNAQQALAAAIHNREQAETQAKDAEREVTAILQAAADRREAIAKLSGGVSSARSRVEAAHNELERLRTTVEQSLQRREQATQQVQALHARAQEAAHTVETTHRTMEQAVEAFEAARTKAQEAQAARSEALRAHDTQAARAETLRASVRQPDGSQLLQQHIPDSVIGVVAELLSVKPGWEKAITAALGPLAEALALRSHTAAAQAFDTLRAANAGRAHILVASESSARGAVEELPTGVQSLTGILPAAQAISAVPTRKDHKSALVLDTIQAELALTVLVHDMTTGLRVLSEYPQLRVVTRQGDIFTSRSAHGGAEEAVGSVEILAQAEKAERLLKNKALELEGAETKAQQAHHHCETLRPHADKARAEHHLAEQAYRKAQDELSRTEAILGSAQAESERFDRQLSQAQDHLATHQHALTKAINRLEAAQNTTQDDVDQQQHHAAAAARDQAQEQASAARHAETEARLGLRSLEEQARALGSRAQAQERAAAAERLARQEAARRAELRRVQANNAEAVMAATEHILCCIDRSVEQAEHQRTSAENLKASLEAELQSMRARDETLTQQLKELTDKVHHDELARAQYYARIETFETKSVEELGLTPDALVENYGPHVLIPEMDIENTQDDPQDSGRPYVRAEQEKRLATAQKDLAKLGRVNPLALEEFAALEERHSFLSEQLEDLKKSRADLRQIIKDVDEHVEKIFTQAWKDVEREFTGVFATLFPGGEGRLRLTDPTDYLTTGIEVEAKPAGKKIKRLSLLSGGERSLTAIAMLVAIFKARPSPFYVLDEVEAALDDRNLGRLLTVIQQLQESSQLIVITHQKRTMEIADAVYGVTMRDGVTTVLGQRLKELR